MMKSFRASSRIDGRINGYGGHIRIRSRCGYSTAATVKLAPKKLHKFLRTGGVILGLGVAGYTWDRYRNSSTISRSVYALSTLSWIAWKYSNIDNYKDPNELHELASELLYNMLMRNKGLYIKFGQAIANQGTVFPVAFQKRFIKLYDEAAEDSWETIDATLTDCYGAGYEGRIFEHIEHKPIASASIAQVHEAKLITGEKVAVKVQHHYISNQVAADLWCYRVAVKLYEFVFSMPMSFYAKYVSDQTLLETDFENEIHNAETLRGFITNDKSVRNLGIYIPKNYAELSDKNVIVSEWIDGIPLTHKKKLLESNFNLATIMYQFITIFGKQIFSYGFVHSDPHPGNILIRKRKGKQEFVLLDHGLYVRLPEKFKVEYSQLWRALFAFDRESIKEIAKGWGINSVDMFVTSIQLKPIEGAEQVKITDRRQMMREFFSDTNKFPFDLLFLSRTMRIIQTCNKNLGSPVNRINTLTDEAINSLLIKSSFKEFVNLLKVKTSLFISTLIFWFYRAKQILRGDRNGEKGLGLEDDIERYFKKMASDMGMPLVDAEEIH